MVYLLATLLSAAPVLEHPPARTVTLRAKVDFGGMIISYWYVPGTRAHIEAALDNARGSLLGTEILDGAGLLRALPVTGPWITGLQEGAMPIEERALLWATGVLQLVGLSLGAMHLFEPPAGERPKGPVLSFSPIASGRLGISVRIVGY